MASTFPTLAALALDLGGIVTNDPMETVTEEVTRRHRLAPARVEAARRGPWDRFSTGPACSAPAEEQEWVRLEFWGSIIRDLGLPESPADLDALMGATLKLLDDRWLPLLEALQQQNFTVWIVSNQVCFIAARQLALGLRPFIAPERLLLSNDIGYVKSSGRPFDLLLERSGLNPADLLFFDDRCGNVKEALRRGIPSVWLPPDLGAYDLVCSFLRLAGIRLN